MKVLFSSWNETIVDNRGKSIDDWERAVGLKLPAELDSENRITAFMGWAGIIIREETYNIIGMCRNYMRSVQNESCGKCFPCRIGTAVMLNHLDCLMSGKGTEDDIAKLESLGKNISETSKCSIGKTGPIPILHAIKYFRDRFNGAVKRKNPIEDTANYVSKSTAPCHSACPASIDIPEYIEEIKDGDFLGALNTVYKSSPMASSLGRSCFHPCENNCRRENVDRAIAICKLKRFAWDYEDKHVIKKQINSNKHVRSERIAVIGAGPAGLSAAYYLALYGYKVVLFEALPVPGGMVAVGIPQYRVPKETLLKEARLVESMGVEIKYGTEVGRDITLKQIKEQGYKAVFVAQGAHLSKKMGVEGEDKKYEGFLKGIDFLREYILTGKESVKGKKVLVVGGGNVAMDCARSPVRMGADVTVVYRRTRKELPADPHEVHEADAEGVKFAFLVAPKKIVEKNGKVIGLECVKMELGPPDDSGRRRPMPIEGSEYVIPGDVVIQAIGQDCDLSLLDESVKGLKLTRWQTIDADPDTMQTNIEWVFTGGDVFNGPLSVVDACANAKRAAISIHQYIQGEKPSISTDEKMDKVIGKLGAYNKDEKIKITGGWERLPMPTIEHEKKISTFIEVEKGYTPKMAVEEASRCMRCYQVGMVVLSANNV